ncbi:MAG: DNA primase [Candidatus Marinimicrobia bacterium]|nr:DNA primase [Candidatus Neomarinimicrobiota bacterium]MBL7010862.1 DNA primase [Candidatus Neomarinimicrobiota bacterium]MBL7030237.1 DNA primase [Candidatus Neomarinimicrobiota bacterium]
MARIPQETIDRIHDTADILDVVSRHVDLKKRGRNFFGLCPFHNEKTPSFSVAPEKGIYHCFGCGNGGNAVNFIMEFEKISFVEAIQQLGDQFGVPVEFTGTDESKEFFTHLYEIHQLATDLYHKALFSNRGEEAKKYLLDRGLSEASLKLFKVGFAPTGSSFLWNAVKTKDYTREVLEKSGLFGFSNNDVYDRFRSRIMFPISNASGKIIAFGGRVFGTDDPAKYMNSPETPLYRKSEIFYGLNLTRDNIRKSESAILVEGYTDLIQLFQAGIKNVVAVSGTAFTEKHVQQIRRFSSKVYLAYDGDSAGIKAALRAGYVLLKGGVEPHIIEIPDGMDPDDWIQKDGGKEFKSIGIKKASGLLRFHLKTAGFKELSSSERSNVIKEILSEAAGIPDPIIRQGFIKTLAQVSGVEENQMVHMFSQQLRKKRSYSKQEESKNSTQLFTTVNAKAELGIIKVLAGDNAEAKELIKEKLDMNQLENDQLKKLAQLLIKKAHINPAEIIASFDAAEDREIVSRILMEEDELTEPIQMAEECLNTISKVSVKEKIRGLRIKIREKEAEGEDAIELMMEVVQLQKEING